MYQKLVTVFSKRERDNLHRQGCWVDKQGNILPVKDMSYDRLEKLVRMLAGWAMKEDDPIQYLRNLSILPYVYVRIVHFGMSSYHANLFKSAVSYKVAFKEPVKDAVKKDSVMWCLTHETWVFPTSFIADECVLVSCPPPEMEKDWELHVSAPTQNELELSL